MYKMIVFDCDGTLVDSSIMIQKLYEGYQKMYPNRPLLPYEHFVPCYFQTDRENLAYLHIPPEDKDAFETICFHEQESEVQEIKAFPGIDELLTGLLHLGYETGIATSRSYEIFCELKTQLCAEAFEGFSCIGVQEVVSHTKPAPDVLYYIMEKTGYKKEELLFVGDSINDAQCAQRCGVDFAWAVWGRVGKESLPCKYKVEKPLQLLDLLTVH